MSNPTAGAMFSSIAVLFQELAQIRIVTLLDHYLQYGFFTSTKPSHKRCGKASKNRTHPNNLDELRNSEANSAPRNLIYGATLSTRSREFQREILMVIETGL
ncbi:hypothetical protein V6N13_119120 [Hibiscus sabdariffa]